jgi:aspartyl/asparaginyl beta-hydroxylase (cupin superfamily)
MTLFAKDPLPWLSDSTAPYPHAEAGLYDPADFPWVAHVEAHWETIRDELREVLRGDASCFNPYPDLNKTNKKHVWKTTGLIYWTWKSRKNILLFPKTWAIVRKLPNLTACSFNKLEPQSTIKPHIGDTNAMYRCHLGLVVPAQAPRCGLRVGRETTCWREGKVLIFNDAYEHTAWNNTDSDRYILSFDIMRPEFARRARWTAAQVLGKISVEGGYQHKAWLRRYFAAEWQQRLLAAAAKFSFHLAIIARGRLYRKL